MGGIGLVDTIGRSEVLRRPTFSPKSDRYPFESSKSNASGTSISHSGGSVQCAKDSRVSRNRRMNNTL